MMIYIRVGVRFQRKSEDRCSMNLRNIMCGLPSMRKKFKLTSIIKPESCLQEYFVNVGDTIEFQHLWCQISGPSYRNFGIVMKSLKRGVTLGKWLAHRRKMVLCTLVELLVSLLERREWRKKWVGRYLRRSYSRSLIQRRRQTPRKEKNGLRHVLKRHERFMQKVQEYRSTLPVEGQDAPLSQ